MREHGKLYVVRERGKVQVVREHGKVHVVRERYKVHVCSMASLTSVPGLTKDVITILDQWKRTTVMTQDIGDFFAIRKERRGRQFFIKLESHKQFCRFNHSHQVILRCRKSKLKVKNKSYTTGIPMPLLIFILKKRNNILLIFGI